MNSWAIVVGINEYPPAAGVEPLYGAVADAADFADWALHKDGGSVKPDRLYFWSYPVPKLPSARLQQYLKKPTPWKWPATPDATRPPDVRDIVPLALQLAGEAHEVTDGRIYVFFAGHGVQTVSVDVQKDPQTCFITNDFRPGPPTMGLIPCEDLRRGLLASGFAEVIMFLDCCRMPMNFNEAAPSLGWPVVPIPDSPYGVGRAARRGTKALETPDKPPKRGAFSRVLVGGLRRQRNKKNQLTLNDLETYVCTEVDRVLGKGKQHPQFEIEPRNPPYMLITKPAISQKSEIVVSFTSVRAGTVVHLTNHAGNRVGKLKAGPKPVAVDAEIGTIYALETPDHKHIKTFPHDGPGATHVDF